ncbi:MAG: CCA tRNA nucleotidyltransferase [Haloarculaceae archaeon]
MTGDLAAVLDRARERVVPTDGERERLGAVAAAVIERAEAAVADLPVAADVVQVGSTARGTWVAGDRDVDVFVCFPPALDRERLEEYGLQVGHAVLPDGREEYAEHPYVVGTVEGYEVDLVPCYAVADATAAQSAVDRTPFHTEYLETRIDDALAADVCLCKGFLKAVGAYGSDLKTRGFSGYLTELLVLEYGGFEPLVRAVADWDPPVRFDPAAHGTATFDDPLVVIDPTDPERNVAAVCSATNVARFQHYARDLLTDPRIALFEPDDPDPYDADAVRAAVAARGTTPVALAFDAPDLVDDQLWPQLRRSLTGIAGELDRRGFDVLRATAMADDRAALLFELEVAERPAVERHEGPPVAVREHAEGFYRTYADGEATGPFIDGDRYVVEREREYERAVDLLASDAVFEVALGAQVESALADGYDVLAGASIAALADPFGVALARYFEPKP